MGYKAKIQVIQRKNNTRQFYLMIPAQTAEALEFTKGEEIELIIETKEIIALRRQKQKRITKEAKH